MKDLRPAKRMLPKYDSENEIGFVARARFAMLENRVGDLTVDEQIQFQRCTFVDDLVRQRRYFNDRELRNMVMAKYQVSWDTANRDIRNARELFNASTDDREYFRSVYIEDLERTAQKAQKAGDFKAYEKIMKQAGQLRFLFEKPKEDVEYDKLTGFQMIIEFNPEAMGFKTIKNKDKILAKYKSKRDILKKIAEAAEDAELE